MTMPESPKLPLTQLWHSLFTGNFSHQTCCLETCLIRTSTQWRPHQGRARPRKPPDFKPPFAVVVQCSYGFGFSSWVGLHTRA